MGRFCLAALWVLAAGGPVLPQERTWVMFVRQFLLP